MRSELEVVVGLNILKITWIEVEMKKFRLYSNSFVSYGKEMSLSRIAHADSYADVIEHIESEAGWCVANDCAFKVAYIEEVVE